MANKNSYPVTSAKSPALHHIKRVDGRTNGWLVRLRRANYYWSKSFADSSYGGKRGSLKAAKAWRDEVLASANGPDYELWKRKRSQNRNTSGNIGVVRSVHRSQRQGKQRVYWYWQANWIDLEGRRRSRTFGIQTHGEQRAWQLATRARRAGLADLKREAMSRLVKA